MKSKDLLNKFVKLKSPLYTTETCLVITFKTSLEIYNEKNTIFFVKAHDRANVLTLIDVDLRTVYLYFSDYLIPQFFEVIDI